MMAPAQPMSLAGAFDPQAFVQQMQATLRAQQAQQMTNFKPVPFSPTLPGAANTSTPGFPTFFPGVGVTTPVAAETDPAVGLWARLFK
jgi:hypothetical protein